MVDQNRINNILCIDEYPFQVRISTVNCQDFQDFQEIQSLLSEIHGYILMEMGLPSPSIQSSITSIFPFHN